jgi:hypothetical protein
MLGPNPKKAATPSTATSSTSSSSAGSDVSHGDGLMVKAIDDIFKFVENSQNPQEFRVSIKWLPFCVLFSFTEREKNIYLFLSRSEELLLLLIQLTCAKKVISVK